MAEGGEWSVYASEFAHHAGSDLNSWHKALGSRFVHSTLGSGVLTSVAPRKPSGVYFCVAFDGEDEPSEFPVTSISRFTYVFLPTQCKDDPFFVTLAQHQFEREEQERKELERKRQAAIAEEERRRQQARTEEERRLRAEEATRQRIAEEEATKEFAELRDRYGAQDPPDTSPSHTLFRILKQIDSGEVLSEIDVNYLVEQRQHMPLAMYFEARYRRIGDPWSAVRACSQQRKAGIPQAAIALSGEILESDQRRAVSTKALAALLTTCGGAWRDLNHLDTAESCANEAIGKDRTSYQPHNLLGALHYQRGKPQEGDICFKKAEELGAPARDQDKERRQAVERAGVDEKKIVATYLLKKDPVRYHWARFYL